MRFKDDAQRYIYYHGQIDLGYYLLNEMSKVMALPKHPLVEMIDQATGASNEDFKRWRKEAIKLISDIIRHKKAYNYDTSYDETFLNEVKTLRINVVKP